MERARSVRNEGGPKSAFRRRTEIGRNGAAALTSQIKKPVGIMVPTPPVWPGARIGIMGGSFNPPHEGHLIVARTALKRLRLDALWWLVTPGNPLKSHDGLPTAGTRIAAIDAMTDDPRMIATAFEAELGTPYTAATLEFLIERHPMARFVWVMGADNLATFHRWQSWRRITQTVPIAVIDRPGWRHRALASSAARTLAPFRVRERYAGKLPVLKAPAWVFLTNRLSKLSSTALRRGATP